MIDQSINQSSKQLINWQINRSINQSIDQLTNKSIKQSINWSIERSCQRYIDRSRLTVLSTPSPFHFSPALILGTIKETRSAHHIGGQRRRLQPVRQDNVGIHGSHVQMINQRILIAHRVIPQVHQLRRDRSDNVREIGHILQPDLFLLRNGVLHRLLDVVDQLLHSLRHHAEFHGNVRAKNARLQGFHVAADVRLRFHQMAVVGEFVVDRLLLVGKNDVGLDETKQRNDRHECREKTWWKHDENNAEEIGMVPVGVKKC